MNFEPTRRALERAVRAHVALGSGLASSLAIPGNDSAPAPEEPYATVTLISSALDGTPYSRYGADGEEDATLGAVLADYSVQWLGEGSYERAHRFRFWCSTPLGIRHAHELGFTFNRCGPVRQIDAVISAAWEERSGVDLSIAYRYRYAAPASEIGTYDCIPLETNGEPQGDITYVA